MAVRQHPQDLVGRLATDQGQRHGGDGWRPAQAHPAADQGRHSEPDQPGDRPHRQPQRTRRIARAIHQGEPQIDQVPRRRKRRFLRRDLDDGLDAEVVKPPGVDAITSMTNPERMGRDLVDDPVPRRPLGDISPEIFDQRTPVVNPLNPG